jgi:predicted Holliday junction resolvase-like endonuclease
MITFVIILIIIVLILGYISYNLFKKVEQLERIVDSQELYIAKFSNTVDFTNRRLDEIDEKGTFKSDDEIGWFFESVKTLQNELDDFNLNGVRR